MILEDPPKCTRMSMELSNYLVSWVVTYLGDLQPTYINLILYRGYNLFTKYHGHPSNQLSSCLDEEKSIPIRGHRFSCSCRVTST